MQHLGTISASGLALAGALMISGCVTTERVVRVAGPAPAERVAERDARRDQERERREYEQERHRREMEQRERQRERERELERERERQREKERERSRERNRHDSYRSREPAHMGRAPAPMSRPGSVEVRVGAYFRDAQRAEVHDYYRKHGRPGHCPPGLAKKRNGCQAPGQARKWSMGRPLPRDVSYQPVEADIRVKLGTPPAGHEFVRVASDILLIAVGTSIVLDAIEDIGAR